MSVPPSGFFEVTELARQWAEKRLGNFRKEQGGIYWIGLYDVFPELQNTMRIAYSGPVPNVQQYAFTQGNVGDTARSGISKVSPEVSIDPGYIHGFPAARSQAVLALNDPFVDLPEGADLMFYSELRENIPWGVIDAQSERPHHFNSAQLKELENFADTFLPFLRMKHEWMRLFIALDEELEKLVQARAGLGLENWTGIYFNAGTHLELGPYRGFKTEHHVIAAGRGLCGAAAREGKTIVTGNVRELPEYLACSVDTRSEIVIPILNADGSVFAELDLDSPRLNAYLPADQHKLELWCADLPNRLRRKGLSLRH